MDDKRFLDYSGLSHFYNKLREDQVGYSNGVPVGMIAMWSGTKVPSGWVLCNGQNGTPDLRSKFILGATSSDNIGVAGGSTSHTLTVDELPSHSHTYSAATMIESNEGGMLFSGGDDLLGNSNSNNTGKTGNGKAIDIMPPYYTLAFIMKCEAIDKDTGVVYRFVGSVDTFNELQSEHMSNNKVGDVYNIVTTGENYGWDGESWIFVGLSFYNIPESIDASKIEALFD